MNPWLRAAGAACLLTLGASSVSAQQDVVYGSREKSVRITRAANPPVIDGKLDEAVWTQAVAIDDLHEIQPTEYADPSERTVIYVLYDDDALYVGARLYDREPDQITGRILRQGEQVFGDDWFSVMIDPFHDRRSGYRFMTNPNGLRQEGLYQNVSDEQWEWQGIWYAAGAIDDEGWVTEIAIPFKSLSFDPNNDTWGINFRRAIARRDERIGWVSRNRNTDPSTSGIAVGFEGLQQGMGLDVVPSASIRKQREFNPTLSRTDFEPSLDVFYKVTPGITSALTINTDFSATEVDDRQVNLTRFGLFFPEKRDFFLQDADIFEFGGLNDNGRPFFSRSIGLSGAGEPVDLKVGGKLSGRIARFNVGALAIRQDEFAGIGADNAIVTRASANVLSESTLGFIATEGDPHSNLDNSVQGVDFLYRNSQLPSGRLVESNIWAQQSSTEGLHGNDSAYGMRVSSPNNSGFRGGFRFTHIGENFNPALGFINRAGIEQINFGTQYTHRPREGRFRSMLAGLNGQRVNLIAGGLQSQQLRLRLIELESRQGDEFQLENKANKEVLLEPFEISDGVVIPIGAYDFDEASFTFATADQRKVWGRVNVLVGDFYGGDRQQIEASVSWRPSGRFLSAVSYGFNDIDLPQGNFETRLVSYRAEIVFSSTLSWVTLIQYDNISEVAGINSRIHWIPEPGREAFLVLNHSLQDIDRDNSFHSQFSEASIKFNYTFRF
jgi:hypothetical protein